MKGATDQQQGLGVEDMSGGRGAGEQDRGKEKDKKKRDKAQTSGVVDVAAFLSRYQVQVILASGKAISVCDDHSPGVMAGRGGEEGRCQGGEGGRAGGADGSGRAVGGAASGLESSAGVLLQRPRDMPRVFRLVCMCMCMRVRICTCHTPLPCVSLI